MNRESNLSDRAATLQEAIDSIVQTFGHPEALKLSYENTGQEKRTIIEFADDAETVTYELRFDGSEADNEPELVSIRE